MNLNYFFSSADAESDWPLTLPYYVISGSDVGTIVRRVRERRGVTSSDAYGPGLMLYLDYMFFTLDHPISCSQVRTSPCCLLFLRGRCTHWHCTEIHNTISARDYSILGELLLGDLRNSSSIVITYRTLWVGYIKDVTVNFLMV